MRVCMCVCSNAAKQTKALEINLVAQRVSVCVRACVKEKRNARGLGYTAVQNMVPHCM